MSFLLAMGYAERGGSIQVRQDKGHRNPAVRRKQTKITSWVDVNMDIWYYLLQTEKITGVVNLPVISVPLPEPGKPAAATDMPQEWRVQTISSAPTAGCEPSQQQAVRQALHCGDQRVLVDHCPNASPSGFWCAGCISSVTRWKTIHAADDHRS